MSSPEGSLDDVPRRVVAVYAHPDDPEVSCAGTLAKWAAAGSEVHLVIGTRGEKGIAERGTGPDQLAGIRADEVAAAADVMGLAGHVSLGYDDGEIQNSRELRAELVSLIRGWRPDVVVAPDPTPRFLGSSYINHRDHREIGDAVLDAVSPAAASPGYFPDAGAPHQVAAVYLTGTLEPDTWVDISASIEAKVAALGCHRSQLGEDVDLVDDVVRQRAKAAGRDAGLSYAEAFRVIRLTRR
jgi:LmbE family N-acetylglucosaminyl deacetylase